MKLMIPKFQSLKIRELFGSFGNNYLWLIGIVFIFASSIGLSQNPDINLLRDINLHRPVSLDATFRIITNSAGPLAYGTPVVLFTLGLVKKDSLLKRQALIIGVSVLSSALLTNIFKYTINRPRPFVTYPDIQKVSSGGSPSFPSGHTADAFSLATSLSLVYPKWYVIIPSYTWAASVAYSRMDLGVHYPTDILGGIIIGSANAILTHKINQWMERKSKQEHVLSIKF